MCGRFTLTVTPQALVEMFGLDLGELPPLAPRFNIAPAQAVPIVRVPLGRAARELALVQWGLVPHWAKDPKIGHKMINARSETIAEKPAFRAPLKYRRCLVPADGFYEWKGKGSVKQPYYTRLKGGGVFGFAGLWETWDGADGSYLETCTILTTEANALTRQVHDRMPVILPPEDYDRWLAPAPRDPKSLLDLLKPYPADQMEAWSVSLEVNRPSEDRPEFVHPQETTQPELFAE